MTIQLRSTCMNQARIQFYLHDLKGIKKLIENWMTTPMFAVFIRITLDVLANYRKIWLKRNDIAKCIAALWGNLYIKKEGICNLISLCGQRLFYCFSLPHFVVAFIWEELFKLFSYKDLCHEHDPLYDWNIHLPLIYKLNIIYLLSTCSKFISFGVHSCPYSSWNW